MEPVEPQLPTPAPEPYPPPLTVIPAMSSVGHATLLSNSRSFPTATMSRSMSSECAATVTPSNGNTYTPISIQNPWAWNE